MNLHQLYLTHNECYEVGRKMAPKGIMVHSTGSNNPYIKRYVGPDDGLLGANVYGNHWNQNMDRQVCVHAFVGKLQDGTIATYQTLPWDMVGWHSGSGSKGSANFMGYIGFEICEDDLTDAAYLNAVYAEAVDLCVYLCREYRLTEKDIICHSEGHTLGIASNHGDVMHWFPKHGKSMDGFRAAVKAELEKEKETDMYKVYISAEYDSAKTAEAMVALLKTIGVTAAIEETGSGSATVDTPSANLEAVAITEGSKVMLNAGAKWVGGKTPASWVYQTVLVVMSVSGNTTVVSADGGDNYTGTAYLSDLTLA
jgi:N-acetylmuramoyl-L-alanine amidase